MAISLSSSPHSRYLSPVSPSDYLNFSSKQAAIVIDNGTSLLVYIVNFQALLNSAQAGVVKLHQDV